MVTTHTVYDVTQEKITFERPTCIICKRERFAVTQAPYGSLFAGQWICDECWREHLDPAIVKARKEK